MKVMVSPTLTGLKRVPVLNYVHIKETSFELHEIIILTYKILLSLNKLFISTDSASTPLLPAHRTPFKADNQQIDNTFPISCNIANYTNKILASLWYDYLSFTDNVFSL